MKPVHRWLEASQQQVVQGTFGVPQGIFDTKPVIPRRPTQDITSHQAAVAGVVDTNTQAPEIPGTEQVDGIAQPVVTGMAASLLEAHGAHGQVQLIVRDQDALGGNLEVTGYGSHRPAAVIHIRGGLEQAQIRTAEGQAAEFPMEAALGLECLTKAASQNIRKPEAHVVPGGRVFGTGVAEPDDKADSGGIHEAAEVS
jgi:hypothetical protein